MMPKEYGISKFSMNLHNNRERVFLFFSDGSGKLKTRGYYKDGYRDSSTVLNERDMIEKLITTDNADVAKAYMQKHNWKPCVIGTGEYDSVAFTWETLSDLP